MMFDPRTYNSDKYDEFWNDLNTELNSIRATSDGLPGVLKTLQQQQFDQGFVQDDLSSLIRCRLCDPVDHSRAFSVQYNPTRANRGKGAGRTSPPAGATVVNGGCFLDRENVRWQQRGIEMGYDLAIGENQYIEWMNPFPLMPVHTTIARKDHHPQSWLGNNIAETEKKIREILGDFFGNHESTARFHRIL
jgi:hypothetical protein